MNKWLTFPQSRRYVFSSENKRDIDLQQGMRRCPYKGHIKRLICSGMQMYLTQFNKASVPDKQLSNLSQEQTREKKINTNNS